jgi:hypothetical protein
MENLYYYSIDYDADWTEGIVLAESEDAARFRILDRFPECDGYNVTSLERMELSTNFVADYTYDHEDPRGCAEEGMRIDPGCHRDIPPIP